MANNKAVQLLCHRITSTEPDLEALYDLQQLSVSVFTQYLGGREDEHPSFHFEEWKARLELPNAVCFYATTSTSDRPLGFFYAVPKVEPEIGRELFHIWLVAVEPSSQGLGIFPFLMKNMKEYARGCGYKELTIATRPKSFKKMYRILGENGWEEVAWRNKAGDDLKQVLMRTSI